MSLFITALLLSLIATFFILRYGHLHQSFTFDYDLKGIQKFHHKAVPRIGGLGLLFGVSGAFIVDYYHNQEIGSFGLILLLSSFPAFVFGFIEDITKKVSIRIRFLAIILSSLLAGSLLGAWLTSLQIFGIDNLMSTYPLFAIVVTCFAITGVTNSFNIIDGYNGLSGMVAFIILGGIAYVAFRLEDFEVLISSLVMMGAILGFLIFNYPKGSIFLGDGGAYLIGFWVAVLSVLLTSRNLEVSKWFPVLLCAYPIFETLFTIYRRIIIYRTHPGMPDASHLHQLIYKRIIKLLVGSERSKNLVLKNSLTAPYLWFLTLLAVIPAILFWDSPWLLRGFAILFAISYVLLYRKLM